jgi:hypothetical protein
MMYSDQNMQSDQTGGAQMYVTAPYVNRYATGVSQFYTNCGVNVSEIIAGGGTLYITVYHTLYIPVVKGPARLFPLTSY